MSIDVRQERIWKKKMAFILAHEIAHTQICLRCVKTDAANTRRPLDEVTAEGDVNTAMVACAQRADGDGDASANQPGELTTAQHRVIHGHGCVFVSVAWPRAS